MRRFILSLLGLIFAFRGLSYGNPDRSFANELFAENDYLRAIGEYQRLIYFSHDSDSKEWFEFQIGECYRKMKRYEAAKKKYDVLILGGVNNSELGFSARIASAKCSINMGLLTGARLLLCDLAAGNAKSDTIHFLLGVTYIKEMKWNTAKNEFMAIHFSRMKKDAFDMLHRKSKENFKSEKTALLLSTFIPGAGQIYASKTLKGIISFSLNFSLGYLTYKAVKEDRKMDAILIVYFGLQRFYFGNIEQARKYSSDFNSCILDSIIVE